MKTNIIVRIVLWSLILMFLVTALVAGIGYLSYTRSSTKVIPGNGVSSYSSPEWSYAGITDLDMDWTSGTISIIRGDVDQITLFDNGASQQSSLLALQDGSTLTISCGSDSAFLKLPATTDLTVLVPQDWICRSLKISSASSSLYVENLTIEAVSIESASGTNHFESCHVTSMDVQTASGDVYFSGTLEKMDCDAASANVCAVLSNTPECIRMDSMSGDLELTLPADTGFTASMDTISGKFSSKFDCSTQNGSYVYGDGRCSIHMDGVSCNLIIHSS